MRNLQICKVLAQQLYEKVGLEGSADWNPENWDIERFHVTRIIPFVGGSITEAFKELAALSKGRWDGVDAAAYVKRLRAD